ncbi:MAG TPA: hypothetical protein HA257_09375 [Candidatus Methanoperedenaceae archaeon]|nr:hypothetical protein [Candidatus Methanoperedenaceae archaeon]
MSPMRGGGETVKSTSLEVTITIPENYVVFWEKLRTFYSLPDDALNQVLSEQFIQYINLMHDELRVQPVSGLCPNDIRKALVI